MQGRIKKYGNVAFLLFIQTTFCACAGPTSPFGAIHQLTPIQKIRSDFSITDSSKKEDYKISFFPKKHIYHKNENLVVTIKGNEHIPDMNNIRLIYNSTDLTDVFLKNSEIKTFPEEKIIKMEFTNLKLSARKQNKINFLYFDNKNYLSFPYTSPSCPLAHMSFTKSLHGFDTPNEFVGFINLSGRSEKINPSLLAGLVAMESGFNPHAVSSAKALGLTQITDIAVEQIRNKTEKWPRRDLSSLSYRDIKTEINSGNMTQEDDWRLEPMLSLRGGANYLKYIVSFWQLPEQKKLLQENHLTTDEALTDIVLASYNSGPERIRRTIINSKKNWLNDPTMSNVRYYVNMIYSYCHYFSEGPHT